VCDYVPCNDLKGKSVGDDRAIGKDARGMRAFAVGDCGSSTAAFNKHLRFGVIGMSTWRAPPRRVFGRASIKIDKIDSNVTKEAVIERQAAKPICYFGRGGGVKKSSWRQSPANRPCLAQWI
jgi:hypothetical protein